MTNYASGTKLKLTSKEEPKSVVYVILDYGVESSMYSGYVIGDPSRYRSYNKDVWDAEVYVQPLPINYGAIIKTGHGFHFVHTRSDEWIELSTGNTYYSAELEDVVLRDHNGFTIVFGGVA